MPSQEFTIYHNPRCSKSRQTLALLEEHNITPQIVEYLVDTPDKATLQNILNLLNLSPRELMRSKESAFEEAGLADESLSDDALLDAMLEHPILIERPIVVSGGQAVIGRPPENVLALL